MGLDFSLVLYKEKGAGNLRAPDFNYSDGVKRWKTNTGLSTSPSLRAGSGREDVSSWCAPDFQMGMLRPTHRNDKAVAMDGAPERFGLEENKSRSYPLP